MRFRSVPVLVAVALAFLLSAVGCGGPAGDTPTEPGLLEPAVSARTSDSAAPAKERYDGIVQSVNTVSGSFALADGTTVQTTLSTVWKSGGDRITSLQGLADALSVGLQVVARGKGTESAPSVIVAEDVDARAHRSAVDQQRFRGEVESSDGVTLVLEDGTEVAANAATSWKSGPDRLTSMQQVADAVDSGFGVRARGWGIAQPDGSVLASRLVARVRESSTRRFVGLAEAADAVAGSITLQDGRVVLVTSATAWKGGPRRILSLEDLETALAAGASVRVKGKGVTQADDSIAAAELDVRFRSPALTRFRGAAESVDPVGMTVTLDDGTIVTVFGATRWKSGGSWLSSLQEIADALAAGDPVRVFGKGVRQDPTNVLAARIRAKVRPGG